jgi:hypothetical protein
MTRRTLREIVSQVTEDHSLQPDWDRQLATTDAIWQRFADGYNTVLLADEVGMGKTYVALAAMAQHIFQTDDNDRKVMLVVPPNNILKTKWEQEIRSFNKNYLLPHKSTAAPGDGMDPPASKILRPVVIDDYWDLIGNLHDYIKQDQNYVTETARECFAFAVMKWADRTRKARAWARNWAEVGDIYELAPDYLNFCSRISPRAVGEFLDDKNGDGKLRETLDGSDRRGEQIKRLLKEFGSLQDAYEPNVYLLGMGTLRRRAQRNNERTQLFSTYLAARALSGKWAQTTEAAFRFLSRTIALPHNPHERWEKYSERMMAYGTIDLWGLRASVDTALDEDGARDALLRLFRDASDEDASAKLLQGVGEKAIALKLGAAGIGLVVVDEVHNWKNGGNGAERFQKHYAPFIERKLIMSATPFQIHEGELERVFRYSSGSGSSPGDLQADKSMSAVVDLLREGGAASSCLIASGEFLKAWNQLEPEACRLLAEKLPPNLPPKQIADCLRELEIEECFGGGLGDFARVALRYREAVEVLRERLSRFIVRHTKKRDKRHFHAGCEFLIAGREVVLAGHERRALYAVPGYGDSDNAMVNFLAMRLDQMVRRDLEKQGRDANAHVLGGLTSSNGAFLESNRTMTSAQGVLPETCAYLAFFERAMNGRVHPKVEATVSRAFENWRRGMKTLIFCERRKTLDEIGELLNDRMLRTLKQSDPKDAAVGGADVAPPLERGEQFLVNRRKAMMKEPLLVDLFWTRSLLAAMSGDAGERTRAALLANIGFLADRFASIRRTLGTAASPRANAKLADLVMLAHLPEIEPDADFASSAARVTALLTPSEDGMFAKGHPLRTYLRLQGSGEAELIESDDDLDDQEVSESIEGVMNAILGGGVGKGDTNQENAWHHGKEDQGFHRDLWQLLTQELALLGDDPPASLLLQIQQGFQKVLLRADLVPRLQQHPGGVVAALRTMSIASLDDTSNAVTPWQRTEQYLRTLLESEGSLNRKRVQSSKRQSLWKGVFLNESWLVGELHGDVPDDTRVNRCAAFNSPLVPDVLVCTAIGSEGIDLHRYCAEVIHHDLPWNPAKLEQRIGRVDRVGSLAERFDLQLYIGIPFLAHAYERFQYETLLSRAQKFEVLLGKLEFPSVVPDEDEVADENGSSTVRELDESVNDGADFDVVESVPPLPAVLLEYLRMDLSVLSVSGSQVSGLQPKTDFT